MMKQLAIGASLTALLTACGGGASSNNQANSTNLQINSATSATNMLEPAGNTAVETPVGAPAARAPSAPPKPAPAPRTTERNQAAPRATATPAPTPAPKAACTPEHREMGHC